MKGPLFVILMLVSLFSTVAVQAENPPEFLLKWGSQGSASGQFSGPLDVACDSQGNVYVADRENDRIQKFTADGAFLMKWGSSGSGDGQFSFPTGVACDSQGNIYVADSHNYRIQKFTADGVFLMKWGSSGSGDGQFNYPTGAVCNSLGDVYVADFYNHRIQKFTADGMFLMKWGSGGYGNGQFSYPVRVACDSQGNVYVADRDNNRIQKFTADGVFLTKWGSIIGSGDGQFNYPHGVACDSQGNVYVADASNCRIQKFTTDGVFLTKWGSGGTGNWQFSLPMGVACDSQGNIYVVENGNCRIQKFGYGLFHILTIKDVNNDQGSQVRINFLRCRYDSYDSPTSILQYEAYRRIDRLLLTSQTSEPAEIKGQPLYPSVMLKDWEFVGAIPAHGEDEYNMIVPTLADSTPDDGIHWSKFFIRATTSSPYVYFDSAVDSGYSVDNLAPNPPSSFNISAEGFLYWDPSPDKDLRYYIIYASQAPQLDQSAIVFGKTSDTVLDARLGTFRYYYLKAVDFAGNESSPALVAQNPVAVMLAMFTAERRKEGVVVSWQISLDSDQNVVFEVFRQENEAMIKVTPAPLIGQKSYEFVDRQAPRQATEYWLRSLSPEESWHGPLSVPEASPLSLSLACYPNPFNPATTIAYSVPRAGRVRLSVYDTRGRLIATVIEREYMEAGSYRVDYRHQGPSGVYFLKLAFGQEVKTQKFVVMK